MVFLGYCFDHFNGYIVVYTVYNKINNFIFPRQDYDIITFSAIPLVYFYIIFICSCWNNLLELELVLAISVLIPVVVLIIFSITMLLMDVLEIMRKITVMRMILVYIAHKQNIFFEFVSFYLMKFYGHDCFVMYF